MLNHDCFSTIHGIPGMCQYGYVYYSVCQHQEFVLYNYCDQVQSLHCYAVSRNSEPRAKSLTRDHLSEHFHKRPTASFSNNSDISDATRRSSSAWERSSCSSRRNSSRYQSSPPSSIISPWRTPHTRSSPRHLVSTAAHRKSFSSYLDWLSNLGPVPRGELLPNRTSQPTDPISQFQGERQYRSPTPITPSGTPGHAQVLESSENNKVKEIVPLYETGFKMRSKSIASEPDVVTDDNAQKLEITIVTACSKRTSNGEHSITPVGAKEGQEDAIEKEIPTENGEQCSSPVQAHSRKMRSIPRLKKRPSMSINSKSNVDHTPSEQNTPRQKRNVENPLESPAVRSPCKSAAPTLRTAARAEIRRLKSKSSLSSLNVPKETHVIRRARSQSPVKSSPTNVRLNAASVNRPVTPRLKASKPKTERKSDMHQPNESQESHKDDMKAANPDASDGPEVSQPEKPSNTLELEATVARHRNHWANNAPASPMSLQSNLYYTPPSSMHSAQSSVMSFLTARDEGDVFIQQKEQIESVLSGFAANRSGGNIQDPFDDQTDTRSQVGKYAWVEEYVDWMKKEKSQGGISSSLVPRVPHCSGTPTVVPKAYAQSVSTNPDQVAIRLPELLPEGDSLGSSNFRFPESPKSEEPKSTAIHPEVTVKACPILPRNNVSKHANINTSDNLGPGGYTTTLSKVRNDTEPFPDFVHDCEPSYYDFGGIPCIGRPQMPIEREEPRSSSVADDSKEKAIATGQVRATGKTTTLRPHAQTFIPGGQRPPLPQLWSPALYTKPNEGNFAVDALVAHQPGRRDDYSRKGKYFGGRANHREGIDNDWRTGVPVGAQHKDHVFTHAIKTASGNATVVSAAAARGEHEAARHSIIGVFDAAVGSMPQAPTHAGPTRKLRALSTIDGEAVAPRNWDGVPYSRRRRNTTPNGAADGKAWGAADLSSAPIISSSIEERGGKNPPWYDKRYDGLAAGNPVRGRERCSGRRPCGRVFDIRRAVEYIGGICHQCSPDSHWVG